MWYNATFGDRGARSELRDDLSLHTAYMPSSGDSRFVQRVVIRNYKSIAACDVELAQLTFFVGPNGSGKSNFLDALHFVADALDESLEHALRARGGFDQIVSRGAESFAIEVDCNLGGRQAVNYGFELGATEGGVHVVREHCFVTREGVPPEYNAFLIEKGRMANTTLVIAPDPRPGRLYLFNASGVEPFASVFRVLSSMAFYNFQPSAMRAIVPPEAGQRLSPTGANLPSVVAQFGAAKSRIEAYLHQIVPEISTIQRVPLGPGETVGFQVGEQAEDPPPFYAANMSDGTLRALGVLTALFQNGAQSPTLVGIEEPETALHPGAAEVLIDGFREASERKQVLVTSHSPDLLENPSISPDEIRVVVAEQGRTRIGPMDEIGTGVLRDRLFTVGELMRMGQLRPATAPFDKGSVGR